MRAAVKAAIGRMNAGGGVLVPPAQKQFAVKCPRCGGELWEVACLTCSSAHFECEDCKKELALDVRGLWHEMLPGRKWRSIS